MNHFNTLLVRAWDSHNIIFLSKQDTVVLWVNTSRNWCIGSGGEGFESCCCRVPLIFFSKKRERKTARRKSERERKRKEERKSGGLIWSIDLIWMWHHLTILCNINHCYWNEMNNIDFRWSKKRWSTKDCLY